MGSINLDIDTVVNTQHKENMLPILCLKTISMSKLRNPRCNEAVAAGFGVTELSISMLCK